MALGGGALSVGLLNGLDNLLSALYSFPGGYLADRLGVKRALLIFNLMAMAGFAIVVLVPSWPAVIAGAVLFLSWTAISLPATMSLVARGFCRKTSGPWGSPSTPWCGASPWAWGRSSAGFSSAGGGRRMGSAWPLRRLLCSPWWPWSCSSG